MDRISDVVDKITKILLVVVLSVMAVVVFTQVLFRYVLHLPLFWTEELARYCLVWASLLGAGVALKKGEHIAVTLFMERLGPRRKSVFVAFLVDIFILAILVIMLWGGWLLVSMTRSQISPALRIPMAIPYLAIPIGSAIMMIHQTAAFYQRLLLTGFIKAKLKLKLATVTPENHAYNVGAREFARLLKEKTEGAVDIVVYPAGSLGSGEEMIVKGLQMGAIDLAVISTGPLTTFSPDIGMVDLPFLFRDHKHVDHVLDGPVGDNLLKSLDKVKGLAFMENGFRHFTNSSRPLLSPKDYGGLKFRTMDNPAHMASIRALGAEPVPMEWGSKILEALQTGAIDGQENSVAIIWANNLDQTQKYLSLTGHIYSPAPLCMNRNKFESLKPDWRPLFLEAAREAAILERKYIRDIEAKQVEDLKSRGMDIRTVDRRLLVEAMESVHAFFLNKNSTWKDMAEKIKAD